MKSEKAMVQSVLCRLVGRLSRRTGPGSGLAGLQWHIAPLLNPDGYQYSRTEDRMWRKNRRKVSGSACRGVDLNRYSDIQ